MGKHKPCYSPANWKIGDSVVIVNAKHVRFSGKKWEQKIYYKHSGYPCGLKETTAEQMREKKPEEILYQAVRRMLQKNNVSAHRLREMLKIYAEEDHLHKAQFPVPYQLSVDDSSAIADEAIRPHLVNKVVFKEWHDQYPMDYTNAADEPDHPLRSRRAPDKHFHSHSQNIKSDLWHSSKAS